MAVGDWRTIRLMGMLEVEAIHEETQRALVEAFRGWRPSAPCVQGERPRRWLAREPKGSESLAEQCGNVGVARVAAESLGAHAGRRL